VPSTITGTVAWTADVSAAGFGSSMRLGRGVVNAAETFAYFPDRQSAATLNVYKLNLATQVWTKLYADSFYANPIRALALSADEATLYAATAAVGGTTPHIYTSATDGSGSATDAASWTASSTAPAFQRMMLDPTTGYLMGADSSGRTIPYLVPGTWGTPGIYYYPPNSQFISGIFPARYDTDKILLAHTTNCSSFYILEYSRRAGRCRAIAGDGSTSGIAVGSAYTNPIGDAVDLVSDVDGRVYIGVPSSVYSLVNGTTTLVRSGGYDNQGGVIYMPTANALLVCDGTFTVRKLT
jgi:hypothetical protein